MLKRIEVVKSMNEMMEVDRNARIQEDELRLKKIGFAHAISPLENPMNIRALRKDLARLKTELQKRKLGL
jgi:large subunit ribosomal protein L29